MFYDKSVGKLKKIANLGFEKIKNLRLCQYYHY